MGAAMSPLSRPPPLTPQFPPPQPRASRPSLLQVPRQRWWLCFPSAPCAVSSSASLQGITRGEGRLEAGGDWNSLPLRGGPCRRFSDAVGSGCGWDRPWPAPWCPWHLAISLLVLHLPYSPAPMGPPPHSSYPDGTALPHTPLGQPV